MAIVILTSKRALGVQKYIKGTTSFDDEKFCEIANSHLSELKINSLGEFAINYYHMMQNSANEYFAGENKNFVFDLSEKSEENNAILTILFSSKEQKVLVTDNEEFKGQLPVEMFKHPWKIQRGDISIFYESDEATGKLINDYLNGKIEAINIEDITKVAPNVNFLTNLSPQAQK